MEQKDLELIKNVIVSVMGERLEKSEASMLKRMDEKLAESENLILDELERTRNILEKQISRVQSDMDEMKQYYRITRLENSNASMLLKITEDLLRRVEVLERGTA